MTRVLIVEDEPQLRRALGINLRARRYEVEAVADGGGALRAAATSPPDLVILDLGLPDMDGVEVVHGLRGWTRIPIIILSARDSQDDRSSPPRRSPSTWPPNGSSVPISRSGSPPPSGTSWRS
jgi:two-component system, OmpR family, KDP operon response regulator KdpE